MFQSHGHWLVIISLCQGDFLRSHQKLHFFIVFNCNLLRNLISIVDGVKADRHGASKMEIVQQSLCSVCTSHFLGQLRVNKDLENMIFLQMLSCIDQG